MADKPVPSSQKIVRSDGLCSVPWREFFDWLLRLVLELRRRTDVIEVEASANPGNIIAGGYATLTAITVTGAQPGDYAEASFDQGATGMQVLATVTAVNTVGVSFLNLGAGAVDLPAGTLRVRVKAR